MLERGLHYILRELVTNGYLRLVRSTVHFAQTILPQFCCDLRLWLFWPICCWTDTIFVKRIKIKHGRENVRC